MPHTAKPAKPPTSDQCVAPAPPTAKRVPHQTKVGGATLDDPYAWLKNRNDPAVREYLKAENTYTAAVTAPLLPLSKAIYRELRYRVHEADVSAPHLDHGYWYYSRTDPAKNHDVHYRKKGTLDAPAEVVLDESTVAPKSPYFALGAMAVSPDQQLLAYSFDTKGDERFTLVVEDLKTHHRIDAPIPDTSYSIAWANDDRTLFYTRLDAHNRPDRLYRHELGTPASADVLVYEEPDPKYRVQIDRSRSGAMLFLTLDSGDSSEVRFLSADHPEQKFRELTGRKPRVENFVVHHGETFYVMTNDGAPTYQLFSVPVATPGRDHWKTEIGARRYVTLEAVQAFRDFLVAWERRRDGLVHIRLRNLHSGAEREVEFADDAYETHAVDNFEFDTDTLRFEYSSPVTPRSIYDYDMHTGVRTLVKRREVPGYDPSKYVSARVEAPAPDGARIPVSLVWRPDARGEGPSPLLLTAYGAYGSTEAPTFSAARLPLLDRGVVFAIAHVRGGGAKGRWWHHAAVRRAKKTTFSDLIAVAEFLVKNNVTIPDRLAISGRTAGGLAVAVALDDRPDLFRCATLGAPYVDLLDTLLDPTLPLDSTEWREWGNPHDPDDLAYLRSYVPYQNVVRGHYPDILVTAGWNDPRVGYWEPAKWVARLRRHASGLVLLRTDLRTGDSPDRWDYLRDVAFEDAFILQRLRVSKARLCRPASPSE